MFVHKTTSFSIYFGDAQESVSLQEISLQQNTQALKNIAQQLQIDQVALLRQEHGTQGLQIKFDDNQKYFFSPTGDYLFTQKLECGIGVVTADCLPIVLHDPITKTVGIIHAGWRGLSAGVFQITIQKIIDAIGVESSDLEIYLGPAARPCCYEVQQDFVDQFQKYNNDSEFFIKKESKIYFDSRTFILVLARNLGISEEKIYTKYNVCTICNESYCSYRREKEKARRQISMICLH
ncbi:MAG: peptidoglycan editing factor PgeF [Candidatus Dependentiae bacterium]|nr:peptidoglycan editing factor PgeF [Candidatus Dependentiae bacterium]